MLGAFKAAMTDRVTFHKRVARDVDISPVYEVVSNVKCLINNGENNSTGVNGVMNTATTTSVYFFNKDGIADGDIVEFDNGERCEIDRIYNIRKFGQLFSYFYVMRK